jgi:hypothetical protein
MFKKFLHAHICEVSKIHVLISAATFYTSIVLNMAAEGFGMNKLQYVFFSTACH